MKKLWLIPLLMLALACEEQNGNENDNELNDPDNTGMEENRDAIDDAENEVVNTAYQQVSAEAASLEQEISAAMSNTSGDVREKFEKGLEKIEEAREKLVKSDEKSAEGDYEDARDKVEEAGEKLEEAREKYNEALEKQAG